MKKLAIKKENIINILTTPIVPILSLFYFLYEYIIEQNSIYFLLFLVGIFLLYKVTIFIKQKSENLFKFYILSCEWFVLDLFNIFSNNMFDFLKPSLLETSIKLTVSYMI